MKQLPGKKDKVGFGFYWMMLPFMLGALSLAVTVGQLLWHLVGIDDLVSKILNASTGIWLNVTFLIMSVVLLIPAIGVTIWWPTALVFRTIELVLSLRPHPEWVRFWRASTLLQEELRRRAPLVHWYTKVMSKFGTDVRHPLTAGRNWVKAFLTTICILTSLVAVPYLIDKSWSMPVGVKPLFSLAMAISSPVVVDYYLQYTMGRRKDRPPTNQGFILHHWSLAHLSGYLSPPVLNSATSVYPFFHTRNRLSSFIPYPTPSHSSPMAPSHLSGHDKSQHLTTLHQTLAVSSSTPPSSPSSPSSPPTYPTNLNLTIRDRV